MDPKLQNVELETVTLCVLKFKKIDLSTSFSNLLKSLYVLCKKNVVIYIANEYIGI